MTDERIEGADLDFLTRVYQRCRGSLDVEVRGNEVADDLGLDSAETAAMVARLVRTGFLRDVGANFRVKITIRTISLVSAERR